MELALAPEIAAMIEDRLRTGEFPTAEAVVTAALHALNGSASGDFSPGEMDRLIAEGERSGFRDGHDALADFRAWRQSAQAAGSAASVRP